MIVIGQPFDFLSKNQSFLVESLGKNLLNSL